jgi:hypothetical protein
MNKKVEVKSNLFPACQNCQAAIKAGEDEINRSLMPDVGYTPPSEKSDFDATVTCTYDTGVPAPGSNIVYEAEVNVDGKFLAGATGAMNWCPGVQAKEQTPA